MAAIVRGSVTFAERTTTGGATAPRLYKRGYTHGCVTNPTSVARTITWYGVSSTGGTAYALKDEDAVAVSQTITANTIQQLPLALAGVPVAVPVTSTGASTANWIFNFYG